MGIQINGNNDSISALDGSWTAEGASINTSGILTATTFKGNIVGTAATFTGPVTIGGTLTYEDVTNIDSVGLITARGGLKVTGGNINIENAAPRIDLTDTGANPDFAITNTDGNFDVTDLTNSATRFRIKSDGNIAINSAGTATNLLDVRKDATSVKTHVGTINGQLGSMPNSSEYGISLVGGNGEFQLHKDGSGNYQLVLGTYQGSIDMPLVFRTDNRQERMRITKAGDVSISSDGTVHGVSKLTLLPANRTTAFSASDGDTWHDVVLKQTGSATNNAVGIAFETSTSGYHKNAGTGIAAVKNGTNSDYGSDLVFITRGQSTAATEKLRITSGGDVCIGRTSNISDAKLNIHCVATKPAIAIQCNHTNTDTDLITAWNSGGKNIVNITAETDNSPYLKFEILSGNTAIERFRVNHLGNVAIGGGTAPNRLEIINDHKGFAGDSDQPNATLLIKHGTSGSNRRWVGIGASLTGAWLQSSSPGGSGLAAPFWINKGGGDVTLGNDRLLVKSNGQIGVNMAPSADAQFCIKNSDDSNYNVLDCYNDNGNKLGGFSQDSTGNGSMGVRTNAGVLNTFFRSSGDSYVKGGRLLIGTDAHSISSSEMFEVKHTGTGFSYFENDNTSGYAPIYINNKGANSGFAPIITITDGSGNRAGLGLDNSEWLRVTGQSGVEIYTGGTHGGGTQHWRLNNLGDLTHTFAGRHGSMIGSTDGSGAYIVLDGAEGNPLSSGSDYMYMEHTSTGQFEMWNGKNGVTTSKFMDVSPAGYIKEPKQPSFAAYRAQSSWTVASGAEMVFNNTRHNIGSHYSTSTGRFTAPVSGSYLFTFFIIYQGNHGSAYVRMFKNGSRQYGSDIHFTHADNNGNWDNIAYSQIFYLAANDYVSMYNGNHIGGYHGNHWMQFCGYLLG